MTTFDYDTANNRAVVAGYSESLDLITSHGISSGDEFTFIQIYNPSHVDVSGHDTTLREYAIQTSDVSRIQAIKWRRPTQ